MKLKAIPVLTDEQVARFWSKVDQSGGPDACWPWRGVCGRKGYGRFSAGSFGLFLSHRIAYQLAYGDLSSDLLVCHTCDNPPCCNPRCLFQGTCAENIHDAIAKGRGGWSSVSQSERMKARWSSPAARVAQSERMKARYAAPAARAAQSERIKARLASPAVRAAQSKRAKAQFASPAARAALSERMKARYDSPAARAAQSERAKGRPRVGGRFVKRGVK